MKIKHYHIALLMSAISVIGITCYDKMNHSADIYSYALANIEAIAQIENDETTILSKMVEKSIAHTERVSQTNGGIVTEYEITTYECIGSGPIFCPMVPEIKEVKQALDIF